MVLSSAASLGEAALSVCVGSFWRVKLSDFLSSLVLSFTSQVSIITLTCLHAPFFFYIVQKPCCTSHTSICSSVCCPGGLEVDWHFVSYHWKPVFVHLWGPSVAVCMISHSPDNFLPLWNTTNIGIHWPWMECPLKYWTWASHMSCLSFRIPLIYTLTHRHLTLVVSVP